MHREKNGKKKGKKETRHLTVQLVYDTIRENLAPGVTNRGVYTYVREIGRAINVN